MNQRLPKILVVDDEPNILKTIGICFEAIGYPSRLVAKPQEALEVIRQEQFDLAFVDLKMSPLDGMEVLAEIKRTAPLMTVIIITAHGSIDGAIEAIRKGAYHYVLKPFDFKELQLLAQRAWEHHQLTLEVNNLRRQLNQTEVTTGFVTRNREMRAQLDIVSKIAESTIPVLLEGESGTGKELIAQMIHQKSSRSQKPFVRVNCAALPEELLESELFGHVKGAFTGALKDRQGRFERADGGTIFLDEIAEIPSSTQAKLLRVLQSKEFERVGESVTRTVDVRVIAATNRNLDEALREGTFREDLFYRLNGMRIRLLPLRERPEDIPLLIQHFIMKFAPAANVSLTPETMKILRSARWSGNVRELENVIQRAILLADTGEIRPEHLPEELRTSQEQVLPLSLEEVEKLHIKRVLQIARDLDDAARILGIDPTTLWRKRKKYGM
ncbi:MAG TPA: sigma-54 dependent transcriptional regulator [Bacteroidota bacterium]|nr:sigma-54 dependent transcriptional regulator [Bacteroidota bacterium]